MNPVHDFIIIPDLRTLFSPICVLEHVFRPNWRSCVTIERFRAASKNERHAYVSGAVLIEKVRLMKLALKIGYLWTSFFIENIFGERGLYIVM